jgi:hypothetical protein
VYIFLRIEDDIASVRLDSLVAFHGSIVDLTVDAGISVVETSKSLEESRTSTARTSDDQHHLARLDHTGKVLEEVSLSLSQTGLSLLWFRISVFVMHVVSSCTRA